MELPRFVHDELLHKFKEPRERHLAHVLHAAEVEIPVKDLKRYNNDDENMKDLKRHGTQQHLVLDENEHTPLLKPSPSGHHVVAVDADKVEESLNAEEKDAIEEDAKLPSWTIIGDESVILIKLSVPIVSVTWAATSLILAGRTTF